MRNHYFLLLVMVIVILVVGVFGVETDGVKIKMSVMQGDSVTLHTNLTEIQTDEDLKWKFPDDTIIARIDREANITRVPGNISFRGRLKLNEATGSLTITNIKTTDSGVYRLKISHRNWTEEKEFNVTVHHTPVSVMEGDSVTLHTDLTEIQTDWELQWKFPDDTIIAGIDRETKNISVPGNISFKGRLKLNETTGSLTITNIKTTDSGVYQLKISHRNWAEEKMEFNVAVHGVFGVDTDGVKSVSMMEGDSLTLHTDLTEIQTDDPIVWRFGGDIIARLNSADYKWRNIDLNNKTGDLNIRNIQNNQTGVYEVKINNGSVILHRKFNITLNGVFSDDGVKKRSAMKGESVILQTEIISIPEDDVIEWTFGPQDTALAKTGRQNNIIIYNKDDVRFKYRLHLNTKSGDLTVDNIKPEISGQYKVKIITRTYTLQKTFSVTVYGYTAIIVSVICGVIIGVVLAWAVTACCKKCRQSRQKYANRDEHRHVWCWGSSGKKGTFHNYLFKKINP